MKIKSNHQKMKYLKNMANNVAIAIERLCYQTKMKGLAFHVDIT